MPTKISAEELLRLYVELGSPSAVARAAGLSVRGVQLRLRSLGVPPQPEGQGPRPPVTAPLVKSADGRIDLAVTDGVVLVFSDAHYWPGIVTTAHRALLRLCKEMTPRAVIANGDIFDGGSISRFGRAQWEQKPTVAEELKAATERMAEIEQAAPHATRIWTLGNHDARFETQLSAHAGGFEGVPGFRVTDHIIGWSPCWAVWINDQVVVKHRFKGGIHATHNNTVWSGKSIVTGHLHSLKVTPFSDYTGTRFGVDTGTLADPYGPQFSYSELNPLNHRSGFAVLTFKDGRLLWPELVHVIGEDAVEFRGQVLEV